ncbi:MAG: Na(+)/H(+) antiporter subunit D [Candidatus Latescibacteria bacterium]|nr:Na(+)/H(+) antiporter subunit D [Candidatus Latescibacterota bacterium]
MIDPFPPALILMMGSLLIPLLRGRLQSAYMLLLPVAGLAYLIGLTPGEYWKIGIFDYAITMVRIDRLSLVFGYIFHIAALLSVVYALHVKDNAQHVAGLFYAGSAVGALFAGDLITLFVFWELTAVSSVFLIWSRRTNRAYAAGMRYLIVQVCSGMILLAGILIHLRETGSIAFSDFGLNGLGTTLVFVAFGIKCAFPLLHNWLSDAYPEATVTGTVFLSAFTTKLAVYALARGFPGTEILIPIGAAMTVFPMFYAVIENDLRRVLAHSLNIQLGFMVVGIGIGTQMALNGTAAHAVTHVIYKALLFMSMGAVLYRTGTARASELGGLYRSMPQTTAFCIVGAASISAVPFFNGFVSKSFILWAVADGHYVLTWLVLLFASAGVLLYTGIRIPYLAFFSEDSGIRCSEAPLNMRVAMGAAAGICILIGIIPKPLYGILPYEVNYEPYTVDHLVTQYQLLLFSALAFVVLKRTGIYPSVLRSVNLDTDWAYRRLVPGIVGVVARVGDSAGGSFIEGGKALVSATVSGCRQYHGPQSILGRTWLTGTAVLVVTIFLAAFMIFCF